MKKYYQCDDCIYEEEEIVYGEDIPVCSSCKEEMRLVLIEKVK